MFVLKVFLFVCLQLELEERVLKNNNKGINQHGFNPKPTIIQTKRKPLTCVLEQVLANIDTNVIRMNRAIINIR